MPDRVHVFPADQHKRTTHITKIHGRCWCNPELLNACSELGDQQDCYALCWRCTGRGLVPIYDNSLLVFVVHRQGQLTDDEMERHH